MPKLRHSQRLPASLPKVVGCDRIVLPASNNTTQFAYSSGNNIARFEIAPSIGMVSPFKTPRLVFDLSLANIESADLANFSVLLNPYIGWQSLIQQVKVSSLKTGAILADTRFYQRQVGSVVYNSQGVNEELCNYLSQEQKSSTHWFLNGVQIASAVLEGGKIAISLPLTTNLLESAGLLQTHLFGLGQGLQIEVMFASDNSVFYVPPSADEEAAPPQPTYVIENLRLHYDLLRFDASSVSTSGMKQIIFESTDSRSDVIQSNDETRQVPLQGSAIQSLVIDAIKSKEVNAYSADSNQQETFGLNNLRVMIQGQSLPIQQELSYAQANQTTRSGITPIQREVMKGVSHDASLGHIRSMSSQVMYEGMPKAQGTGTFPANFFSVETPAPKRHCFGVMFSREGTPMRYGNLSYRLQSTVPPYATSYTGTDANGNPGDGNNITPDLPAAPTTVVPYTLYTHITGLKVLQVDEGSGLVSVRS